MAEAASIVVAESTHVGSGIFSCAALLVISLLVVLLLRYFLPLRTTPAYLLAPIFLALALPASIILLVPIDLASSAGTNPSGPRGIWLPEERFFYSLRQNGRYQLYVFGSGAIGLVYFFIQSGVRLTSIKALVMALAYCWGLVLAIYLMGHGLVAVPRRFFHNASISGKLRRLQHKAPEIHDKLTDAIHDLEELELQVIHLRQRRGGTSREFQEWIDDLGDIIGLNNRSRELPNLSPQIEPSIPTVITVRYLAELTMRLKQARHKRLRFVDAWDRLVQDAANTQAILDSGASKRLEFSRAPPHASIWERYTLLTPYTRYVLYFHVLPINSYFLGLVHSLGSICVIWSELVKIGDPKLSLIGLTVVHHTSSDRGQISFGGQVMAAGWILYMCASALTSVSDAKVWGDRALVRRNTYGESACWYASQIAKLTVPLAYNFVTLLPPPIYRNTTFYNFLGRLINLTPLGTGFDHIFPMFILIPVLATLFNLYGKVENLLGFGMIENESMEDELVGGVGGWREGRDLIERELSGDSFVNGRFSILSRTDRIFPPPLTGAGGVVPSTAIKARNSVAVSTSASASRTAQSSRPLRPLPSTEDSIPEGESFLADFAHRVRNTFDTVDAPRWVKGMKRPKWMSIMDGDGEERENSSFSRVGVSEPGRQAFGGARPKEQKALERNDSPSTIQPTSRLEILRYRYHHGTNLGSIFVLEQWFSLSMFIDGAGSGSELDAVNASLRQSGLIATRQKWEDHWNTAVSDSDWDWLVNSAHCILNLFLMLLRGAPGKMVDSRAGTTIRLPIGYFNLGPAYCSGTPFDGQPALVYADAWAIIKTFVSKTQSHGIGVLIDLHALPGGANGSAHSGTPSSQAALWDNPANLALSQKCLMFIAELKDGVVGLELCNEAVTNAPGMYGWYDSVITAVGQFNPSLPIYIPDAWNLPSGISYTDSEGSLKTGSANPVIIDTHKYYCFSERDKQQSPQQIIARIAKELGELDGHDGSVVDHGATQVVVGEYSCVLDNQSRLIVDPSQRARLLSQFGQAQIKRWQQRSSECYFWTYKMDWMDGGEWGLSQHTKFSNITPPTYLTLREDQVRAKIADAWKSQNLARGDAQTAHNLYLDQRAPRIRMEHWRFGTGWDIGFSDALSFFETRVSGVLPGTGADKIGMLDIWVKKRIIESGQGGQYLWEFEQGLRQGVSDFYRLTNV
ncbi:hypothetical protein FGG08_002767 [Glutinoglossum americanum]|uniref:Glycoside hydrolase family 5 domain-containing protein n=1 Tax=Glutinoglossum americanum TaxID=1670608 RepID=A0A9P8L492_9PEZI|nr:hypothetical protein FGG08_002767 [Glutinoglossum americanum]